MPKVFNLRTDPFERADITSNTYYDWFLYHDYLVGGAQALASQFLQTFVDFPPRSTSGQFHHRSGDREAQRNDGVEVRLGCHEGERICYVPGRDGT